MRLPPPFAQALKSGAFGVMRWVIGGGLLVGLILAMTQCSIERQNARQAAIQTYNMSRVAAFRDSGAELDKKVAAFNDAVAEGLSLSEARREFRSAMADHAAKTMAMREVFGILATGKYTDELKNLQAAVEETSDATSLGRIISSMSDVYVLRNQLAEGVTKKATA